jgi:hypothetical protein
MKFKLSFYLSISALFLLQNIELAQIQVKLDTSKSNLKLHTNNVMLVQPSSLMMKNPELYKIVQLQWNEQPSLFYWNENGKVYLWWTPVKDAAGFNIYRKKEGESYQKIASNLQWPTDQNAACSQLQNIFPISSSKSEYQHMHSVLRATVPQLYAAKEWLTCPPLVDKNARQALYDLSRLYHQLALVIGYGYFDETAVNGDTYYYKVKYFDVSNQEYDFAKEVKVTAGAVIKINKPTGLIITEGDKFIRLHWSEPNENETVIGYNIYRSKSMSGKYKRLNLEPALVKDTIGINSSAPLFGFVDTLTQNYTKYYYKITARTPTGKESQFSNIVSGMSTDKTPPKIPANFTVDHTNKDTVLLQWSFVNQDIKGFKDTVAGYRIFRYNDYESAIADSLENSSNLIKFVKEKSSKKTTSDVDRNYTDGGLIPEKVYWYRILSIDTAGNVGNKSAALSVIVPDIEPPDSPHSLSADSGIDFIKIEWSQPDTLKKNNKDLAGYLVYRGICGDSIKVGTYRDLYRFEYYPLSLLADIDNKDSLNYTDKSIPDGSPICYRYSVKSYDKSQNLSELSDSTCERLHDRTPPEKPVITALEAGNKMIILEAVAPPIQDIGGFIIERSDSSKNNWQRIYPDSVIKKPVDCEIIPVEIDSIKARKANRLAFRDKEIAANEIYWYRVKCYDLNGNTSGASSPISTFAYDVYNFETPVISSAEIRDNSVVVNWNEQTEMQRSDFLGYVVFRSTTGNTEYRQMSPPLKTNRFVDSTSVSGITYWYKIQSYRTNGDRSEVSKSIKVSIPEQ